MIKKNNHKLINAVSKTVSSYNMFQTGDRVLVALSGGPDSVALLHVLLGLSPFFFTEVGIAHLNHSLRQQDSDDDALFVKNMADELEVPCFIEKKDVKTYKKKQKLSLEEAARRVRYDFLLDVSNKNQFNKIATAHHADDNAELVLMYMLRGTGLSGLSGIPPVRNLPGNRVQIVRPFINVSKHEIIDFLSEKRLKYKIDKSNKDIKYLRNRVRLQLLPFLKNVYNPRIVETLNRTAVIARAEEEWIDAEVIDPLLKKILLKKEDNKIVLSVKDMAVLHDAVKRRIIRKYVEKVKGDLRRISFHHVDSVLNLLEKEASHWSIDLPDRIRIEREYDFLFISKEMSPLREINPKKNKPPPAAFEYKIYKPAKKRTFFQFIKELDMLLSFSEAGKASDLPAFSSVERKVGYFDMDLLDFPFTLRSILQGDRFSPLGTKGTQKVKKYCINNKITRTERNKIPVLVSRGQIIWLVGHRIDNYARVTPLTRTVLKAEIM